MAFFRCATIKQSGGGEGYKVIVTTTVGSLVTISKDQVSFSDTVGQSGSVEFIVPSLGTWNIVATLDGDEATGEVVVEPTNVTIQYTPDFLYKLGTFNVEYGNPADFTYSYYSSRSGGWSVASTYIYQSSGTSNGRYYCWGFSKPINLTKYAKVRVYTNSALSSYVDLDVSAVNEECYIVFAVGCKNYNSKTYTYSQVTASRGKDGYATGVVFNSLGSKTGGAFTAYVYAVELIKK